MARYVELRRHTDADGDVLTPEGVRAAPEPAFETARGAGAVALSPRRTPPPARPRSGSRCGPPPRRGLRDRPQPVPRSRGETRPCVPRVPAHGRRRVRRGSPLLAAPPSAVEPRVGPTG